MKFYNTKRWKGKRQHIFRRDGYICQECKKYGRNTDATMVHHIKSEEDYPELAFEESNLVSLCNQCHNKMHPEKGGYKQRWK